MTLILGKVDCVVEENSLVACLCVERAEVEKASDEIMA